jgi:hypothetical protein
MLLTQPDSTAIATRLTAPSAAQAVDGPSVTRKG